jgi:hypothetical protein
MVAGKFTSSKYDFLTTMSFRYLYAFALYLDAHLMKSTLLSTTTLLITRATFTTKAGSPV